MLNDFRCDLARYRSYGERSWRIAANPAVWCVLWYRIGRVLYGRAGKPWWLVPFRAIHVAGSIWVEILFQMRLNVRAQIGPGLLIAHCGGITLHPETVIGANCDLAHHVTMGTRGRGAAGVPRLGNDVYVGTGTVLVGPIEVGDGARIAANSLVTRSVPAGATAMGVPAVVVRTRAASERMELEAEPAGVL